MAATTLSVSCFPGQEGSFHAWPTEEVPDVKSWSVNGFVQTGLGWVRACIHKTDDTPLTVPHDLRVDGPTPWTVYDSETGLVATDDTPAERRRWAREYSGTDDSMPDADTLNLDIVTVDTRRDGEAGIGFIHRAAHLPALSRMILEECHQTADGKPCLPHINRQPAPWYKNAALIKSRFKTTIEQAETLKEAFRLLDVTPSMAVTFDKWIKAKGIEVALKYFESLAVQMILVTDEGDPVLDLMTPETPVEDNNDFDTTIEKLDMTERMPADVTQDHLLDDPRDNATSWEETQPQAYCNHLDTIRSFTNITAIGSYMKGQYYGTTPVWQGSRAAVAWNVYNSRKAALTPRLHPKALKIAARFSDPKANLNKAAAWLYNEAPREIASWKGMDAEKAKATLAHLWSCYKAAKAQRAPKRPDLH
ncbi:MAG: hypothetical protein CSYNP_01605 [Syntrophus sp. SKADARSKE-3]|nr:hypothetical protein [Syntrophus sp. SKADARSKE-3]